MLEVVLGDCFKKPMFKPLIAIFLTGIDFQAFLLVSATVATMCPQTRALVDTSSVKLIKFDVR